MLKIDVIKFEAQDVITSSIPNTAECVCCATCRQTDHFGCSWSCEADIHTKAGDYKP